MEEIMEARFQKMETSVNTLIESMTTFKPSVSAVETLMEADEELNDSIVLRRRINWYECR
jgi:hypothetical protein